MYNNLFFSISLQLRWYMGMQENCYVKLGNFLIICSIKFCICICVFFFFFISTSYFIMKKRSRWTRVHIYCIFESITTSEKVKFDRKLCRLGGSWSCPSYTEIRNKIITSASCIHQTNKARLLINFIWSNWP